MECLRYVYRAGNTLAKIAFQNVVPLLEASGTIVISAGTGRSIRYSRFPVACPIEEKRTSKLTNQMQARPKHHRVWWICHRLYGKITTVLQLCCCCTNWYSTLHNRMGIYFHEHVLVLYLTSAHPSATSIMIDWSWLTTKLLDHATTYVGLSLSLYDLTSSWPSLLRAWQTMKPMACMKQHACWLRFPSSPI